MRLAPRAVNESMEVWEIASGPVVNGISVAEKWLVLRVGQASCGSEIAISVFGGQWPTLPP